MLGALRKEAWFQFRGGASPLTDSHSSAGTADSESGVVSADAGISAEFGVFGRGGESGDEWGGPL